VAATIMADMQTRFNEAIGSVRVIAFLSPTCGPCRYGQGLVRGLFEEFSDEKLAGYVVWVPMLPADSLDSAMAEQNAIFDPRLHFWFDDDKSAANTWSSFIGLPTTSWDVYAVYDAGAVWADRAHPPVPRVWMHQLNATPATKLEDRLDPIQLAREWLRLLGKPLHSATELADRIHAKGQAVSMRSERPS